MKIYIAPYSEPGFTTLQADVAAWRALLTLRAVPRGGSVSHQPSMDKRKPNEPMSDADWRDTANVITKAIGDQDDEAVVRVRLPAEKAAAVVEMAG